MSTKKQVRCAIYTRKSTEEGLEQDFNSLDAQRESCHAYIASQRPEGWMALADRYDDGGFSGGTLERPALQRLMADIEAGRIDVIVVYKIDRLSRSLMDFARLVEVFDRKSVTFVSVTQSFNTTTSMGRLTLNVLLSFAQFEREVTGERIRDKFAASKKKGMWMGGTPPIGYDIVSRKLLVNENEAETVRLIFERYLDLGCVRRLRDDLIDRGIVSKLWTSTTGKTHGGKPFDRGALYCLLRNRLYVGETLHKGKAWQGEHKAIVGHELFDAVQQRLAASRRRQLGKVSVQQDTLLAGLLFDDTGQPMTPTYSVKPGGGRYRYYASKATLLGERSKAAISRIPAPALEDVIVRALRRLALVPANEATADSAATRSLLHRIVVQSASLQIDLDRVAAFSAWAIASPATTSLDDRALIDQCRTLLTSGETLNDLADRLRLTLPVRARFRGGRASATSTTGIASARPDLPLTKALARAHIWNQLLLAGDVDSVDALAAKVGQERRHVRRTLNLAFLSPDICRTILAGGQPAGSRLAHLLDADIPLSWRLQREWIKQLVDNA
ncbi:MAG TPA: recombinase family protein [Rhizomicrobium sp.]|jgi:DNA invertase Pin-like site-specific DNA recombinase